MKTISIRNRSIYNYCKPYIIAEIGSNHNGDMDLAKRMISSAKECRADAVKFQSWTPDSLISRKEYLDNQTYNDSPKKHFGSLREMVEKYYLRGEQHFELKEYCDSVNIDFCSTPFSKQEVDVLVKLDVPFIKVASMDITNLDLLKYIAQKQKPIVLSTGMATLGEIDAAISILQNSGNDQIVLLHCISVYPPKYEDINLRNISMLQHTFGFPVGFSDHTIGTAIPLASVALGACIIEKHFTIDKDLPGWDHEISADSKELSEICNGTTKVYSSLGSFERIVSKEEISKRLKFRRSIVLSKSLLAGTKLKEEHLSYKRPGTGIPPDKAEFVIGRTLNRDLNADDLLEWKYLE